MERTLVALALLAAGSAHAHGCEGGHQNCATNPQHQWQQQQQQSSASGGDSSATATAPTTLSPSISTHSSTDSRSWSIRPVQPLTPPAVTPTATVSRYADTECQPRMKIVRRSVNGLNNRPMSAAEFEAGTDEYTVADLDEPYRRIEVVPGLIRLLGHRVVETSAVTTVSTGYSWGIGGNGSGGAGGSIGAGGSSGLQRIVTTVRLHECVAYEIDSRPKAEPPAPPKVIYKTRTVKQYIPVTPYCEVCNKK